MNLINLYWDYSFDNAMNFGATPPLNTSLGFSKPKDNGLLTSKDFLSKKRKIESGYIVDPNDCPAILSINNYGFIFKSPGDVKVKIKDLYISNRIIKSDKSIHGYHEIYGQYWPHSDSQKIASWISGSKYIKIHTGIIVYFPEEYILYQGPIPQGKEKDIQDFVVWEGLETYNKERSIKIDNRNYGMANINFILSPKHSNTSFEIVKGQILGVVYPILKRNKFKLEKLNYNR